MKKRLFITAISFAFLLAGFAGMPTLDAQASAFIITVKTDNAGGSNATSFTIPTTGGGYNYEVDWNNDGTYDQTGLTGNVTHNYGTEGTYTLRIKGVFPRIYFNNSGDRQKLLGVQQWGSIAWTSMGSAFEGCSKLNITATDLPNLSGVTDMSEMFRNCALLNGPNNIGSWNTGAVTNMSSVFYGAASFNKSIGSWTTAAVTNMSSMFYGAASFNQAIGNWNTGAVTSMHSMFYQAGSFNQAIGNWNTGAVTSMQSMFYGAGSFNQAIGNWNVSNVTDMYSMFVYAGNFNQAIGNWDVSNVGNMSGMFSGATVFNQPISSWDVSHVGNMGAMFFAASAFNQPIGNWDVSNVTNMPIMFGNASSFNQPISNWDVSGVTNMAQMFQGATSFNQPIGNWDVSDVTDMHFMFYGATAFNQPIDSWDVSNVVDMFNMFNGASSFNQSLGSWTLNGNESLADMLNNCGMDCTNYSATLIGWANNPATPSWRSLGALGRQYGTNVAAARSFLTTTKHWTISGDAASGSACLFCPVLSAAPSEVNITNSICSTGCSLAGGAISAPAGSPCPTGSSIRYSTDGGATWSSTLPTYDQDGPAQTIKTRCSCDADNTVYSPTSSGVTTVPGNCAPPGFTACPTGPLTAYTALDQCVAVVNYAVAAGGSPAPALTYALTGQTTGSGSGTGSSSTFNKGNTLVTVTAANICAPAATCQFTVTVQDNIAPSVICKNATVSLDASCAAGITTTDVFQSGSDNCGTVNQVSVSPNSFNCSNVGANIVTLTVNDGNGNIATCTATVTVNTGTSVQINGAIIWEHDIASGVGMTTVTLGGDQSDTDITPADGLYFLTAASGSNFTVTPTKNINKLNGLTSADAQAIQQHVTFINPLPAPYKRIAADVNKSNSITTLDAALINQVLLGNPQANAIFNTSWRFVPASYSFPNPDIPWGFPEKITLTGVNGNVNNQDFKGIKLGDVAPIWANPANFDGSEPPAMVLRVQDMELQAGAELAAEFRADQMNDLNSFQFALRFDPEQLQLVEIEPRDLGGLSLSMDNFGTYMVAEGEIRVVWSQATPVMLSEATPVFRLRFKVLEGGAWLSEVLQLNEEALPGHAYNSAYRESGVLLEFSQSTGRPGVLEEGLSIQIQPNPFVERTTLYFDLPEAAIAGLRVTDSAGRLLFAQQNHYAAGKHEVALPLGQARGVLVAELSTPFGVFRQRLVAVGK